MCNRGGNAAQYAPRAFAFGAYFWYNCIVGFFKRFVIALFLAIAVPAFAEGVKIDVQAARAGKGVLVFQTGSDWCVS